MKNLLLLFISLLFITSTWAQHVYEDFEDGVADVVWVGLNGVYNGVVDNPAPDAVNSSDFVGSYTNDPEFDFCFALGTLDSPADLSQYNLVKLKVWSPIAPSQVLLKFEGPGQAVEQFREITVANEWVEYTFDLSGGASLDALDKILVSFNPFVLGSTETFYFDDIVAYEALEVYEDFENGLTLPWTALDGEFEGPVANPAPNIINSSDWVGQYTKSNEHAYSLLLAESATPFDLSVLNQFHLNIYATAPTQVLLKLEGSGGPPIERIKNIGLANAWQDYSFDLSDAAEYTHLNRIILFFDPGVEESGDTYYFDNLRATSNPCKNVTLDPGIIDDFECNRNATYANGWDSLTVIDNPVPDGINNSSRVGRYGDPIGEQWAALLIDYQNPMDLTERNQLHAKIWSPREVPILFKLEGGASPAKEIFVDVTTAGQWVEYVVDFSEEALSSHRKIVFFFNAGQDAEDGDVYYIDDIYWGEKSSFVLEDFETGAFLPWAPLDELELLHGTFAVVDNPDPTGVNTSSQVGEYTKGTSAFSTLAAVAPVIIDISTRPQYNLDVWAPESGSVTFQLESVSQGNKEVTRDVEGGVWQTLSFDFTDHQGVTDWASIRLIFNPGTAEPGVVYYFDNLTQSERTVDPCEGTIAIPNIIDDFECQRNYTIGAGAGDLSVVSNPLIQVANSSTYVGLYQDQPNEPWAAMCYQFDEDIDLTSFNQFSLQVLAEEAVPVLLKLEGGATSPAFEVWTDITNPGNWETITGDFSSQVGADHRRACIFFNAGVTTTEVDNYYIDNVQFAHAPFTSCIINFEEPAYSFTEWRYFPADDSGDFELVDNPDPSGVNLSAKVGKAVEKASGAQPWQGMYVDLPAPIRFGDDKIVRMKVWSPQITTIVMKLERPLTPGAPGSSGDNPAVNTVTHQWEELTWDFSASPTPLPDDGDYARITLIWDINNIPAEDVIYYFDDIQLNGGECGTTGIFDGPGKLDQLSVAPNPVMDVLNINDLGRVSRLEIYTMLGQRVASVWVGNASDSHLNVSNLGQGTYILTGYSAKGEPLAITRFVKL